MNPLLMAAWGATITWEGDRRLACHNPGRLITGLMLLPVAGWMLGVVMMVVGAIVDGRPGLLIPPVIGLAASGLMLALARYRWRSMGSFVLDADRGELVKLRGDRPIERWALTEVREFTCVWDWLHRGFTQHYWLVARTHQGRSLRLGKGPRDEARRVLQLLHSWGLPAGW